MQFSINGRFLTRRPTGVDRFAFETLREIDKFINGQDSSVEELRFEIVVPDSAKVESPYAHIPLRKFGRHQGQLWEQFDLPRAVGDGILLNLCNTAPVALRRQVTVIHDAATAAIPAAFSASFRLWYSVLMPLLGYQCREILTVSQFSKNELVRHFRVPEQKIAVVIEGGEHFLRTEADPQALERFGLGKRPFVLAVSSMAAHKNFRQVLAALDLIVDPPFDVAIAGGANSKVFGTGGTLDSDRVHWLGYVSDSELRTLYEGAMAFVFPSVYEGFGIPPLEAMNCGCPVIASKAASIPEVCGEAALYFDPSDPQELADLLLRVAQDVSLRDSLRQKGHSRAAMFSWQQTAREVIAACRRASK